MISENAGWLAPHVTLYDSIKKYLEDDPPTGTPMDFLFSRAHRFFELTNQNAAPRGYLPPSASGIVKFDSLHDGDKILFWNGQDLEIGEWHLADFEVGDYLALGQRIQEFGRERDPLVLDLGSGTSLLAVGMRAANCSFPFLGLELFEDAIAIGELLTKSLGINDAKMAHVDISHMLDDPNRRTKLREFILQYADGRNIIAASRHAIHPFYQEGQYQRLFDFLINDLRVYGGMHLEMCGHQTATYPRLLARMSGALYLSPKLRNEHGTPLKYLSSLPSIHIVERIDIWPHFLGGRWPSFISWTRNT